MFNVVYSSVARTNLKVPVSTPFSTWPFRDDPYRFLERKECILCGASFSLTHEHKNRCLTLKKRQWTRFAKSSESKHTTTHRTFNFVFISPNRNNNYKSGELKSIETSQLLLETVPRRRQTFLPSDLTGFDTVNNISARAKVTWGKPHIDECEGT